MAPAPLAVPAQQSQMSFTKLKDRIDKLPLILAGPLVRRVEPQGATVWVALRRRRRVRLEVYDAAGAVVALGDRETLAVGANLHMACVTAQPATPFSAGTTYQYNLFFDHVGGSDNIPNGANLFDPLIVSGSDVQVAMALDEARRKLTYASDGGPGRPSFVLPPQSLDELRLLHGSCRKVSGDHTDALEAADAIIREALKTGAQRPHMLFLTGDNIYNDGCEREELKVIIDAAPTLLGWDETMPGVLGKVSELSEQRFAYSLDEAGLSSGGANLRQLFGLGETVVLYLLTFAEDLWPADLDYRRHTFDFRGTLPAVRRALANVATYMIFDDHEFTNSWNLTADWVESVLEKPMGRRIYQNALAAYALCQGWGNTPDRFQTGAGKALLDAIVAWSAAELAKTPSPAQPLEQISKSVGLPTVAAFKGVRDWAVFHGPDVVRWDYTVPCPGLNIVVLDTFMWRAYEGTFDNCLILDEAGLTQQLYQAPFSETECTLIVVSNVAMTLPGEGGELPWLRHYGWLALSQVLALTVPLWVVFQIGKMILSIFAPSLGGRLPTAYAGVRAWLVYEPEYGASYEHQTRAFELLMSHAAHRAPQQLTTGTRQGRVVFLSGDIHRSFCMRMEYWSRVPFGVTAAPVEGVLAQLIASPCKWVNPQKYPEKDTSAHHWAGWRNEPTLTWVSQPKKSPWRFKKSPWMTEYVPASNQPRMSPDPEWRYSLAVVEPDLPPTSIPMEIPDRPNPTLEDQLAEMKLFGGDVHGHLEKSPILKVNNLGDVSFKWTPGAKEVVQQVWWRARPTVSAKWTISRFSVSMEPPPTPPVLPK